MKKTLIAMAVLAASGAAFAQTNVTIYGAVDIGYVKETGSKVTMDERYNNRLGFMGSEDLGGGLKATFQLEQRFKLFNGVDDKRGGFSGGANVGLAGNFGAVRFGRLNEISTENYRKIDPFQQYGVAGMVETPLRGDDGEGRLSSAARYDSPNFNGFKFGATYSVQNAQATHGGPGGGDNNGYAVGGTYTNGPLFVVANYNKAVNSNDSNNWNIGAAYAFGPVKLSAGYEQTKDKYATDDKLKTLIVGLSYKVGAGVINASYNNSEWSDAPGKLSKYAIGYTHNLSKRTSVYANYAHSKQEDGYNYIGSYTDNRSSSAVEVGVTHKF